MSLLALAELLRPTELLQVRARRETDGQVIWTASVIDQADPRRQIVCDGLSPDSAARGVLAVIRDF